MSETPAERTKRRAEETRGGDDWQTPEWVYAPWFDRYDVGLDAAASSDNHLCPTYLTKETDALSVDWHPLVQGGGNAIWCNPPYSQAAGPLQRWINKFVYESHSYTVIALLPADTSTNWFWNCLKLDADRKAIVHYLPRRVRHVHPVTKKPGGSPKFGSVIVVFDSRLSNPYG